MTYDNEENISTLHKQFIIEVYLCISKLKMYIHIW